jgi:FtsP/CotA-like multicopper oxidase with cupredoxin domain
MLGHGEPVRARQGERVLFRLLNASATENIRLALPGHRFTVLTLDGNPVPTPQTVDVLSLGVAERADVVVEMNRPGVWILGEVDDDARKMGLGVVVEYANEHGEPQWSEPPKSQWDYTIFGRAGESALAVRPCHSGPDLPTVKLLTSPHRPRRGVRAS